MKNRYLDYLDEKEGDGPAMRSEVIEEPDPDDPTVSPVVAPLLATMMDASKKKKKKAKKKTIFIHI